MAGSVARRHERKERMRDIEGVICDMDGTIVDSEELHLEAWNMVLDSHGWVPPSPDWCAECVGMPETFCLGIVHKTFPHLVDRGDLIEEKQNFFRELVLRRGEALAMPGVRDGLERLRSAGVKLAVATNSETPNTSLVMTASGLAACFSAIITSDVAGKSKPHPAVYQLAAWELGLSPDRCAALEDSLAGLDSARAAGCTVLGVTTTWPAARLTAADYVFATTSAALDWALSQNRAVLKQ